MPSVVLSHGRPLSLLSKVSLSMLIFTLTPGDEPSVYLVGTCLMKSCHVEGSLLECSRRVHTYGSTEYSSVDTVL